MSVRFSKVINLTNNSINIPAIFVFRNRSAMQTTTVETTGHKFKSIKELNDMPADQMGRESGSGSQSD